MRFSSGGSPYAIGAPGGGTWFRVRCIRFGRLAARYEKRPGEKIVPVDLVERASPPRRLKSKPLA